MLAVLVPGKATDDTIALISAGFAGASCLKDDALPFPGGRSERAIGIPLERTGTAGVDLQLPAFAPKPSGSSDPWCCETSGAGGRWLGPVSGAVLVLPFRSMQDEDRIKPRAPASHSDHLKRKAISAVRRFAARCSCAAGLPKAVANGR